MDLKWTLIDIESDIEFLTIILIIGLILIFVAILVFGSLISDTLETIKIILDDNCVETTQETTSVDLTHLIESQQKLIDKLSDDSLDEEARRQIYYEIKAVQKVIDYISK